MKLSEAKSIEKKIILVAFCLILFLIFTATSYGTIDPKYDKLREHPWGHMLSPRTDDNQNLNFILLAINSDFCLILTFQSKAENLSNLKELTSQKSDHSPKHNSSNKNETKSKR